MTGRMKQRGALIVVVLSIALASCKEQIIAPAPVNVKVQALQNGSPVPGELRAQGRRDGVVVWSRSFGLGTTLTGVQLPGDAESFDLRFDSGTASRTVRITKEHLRLHPELIVGLTDADYFVYQTADKNLTVRLSRDPTNPYFEVSFVQNPRPGLDQVRIERWFFRNGNPVQDVPYRLLWTSEADNVTFRSFARLRGQGGDTWDSALSVLTYGYKDQYEELEHEWTAPPSVDLTS